MRAPCPTCTLPPAQSEMTFDFSASKDGKALISYKNVCLFGHLWGSVVIAGTEMHNTPGGEFK